MTAIDKLKAQLVIVTGLVIMYFIFHSVYWLYAAAGIGLISLMIPFAGNLIVKGWFKISELLGWINSRVLLSIIFYVFLFPIAIVARFFSKNALNLKNIQPTLYETRNHKYVKSDLENTW